MLPARGLPPLPPLSRLLRARPLLRLPLLLGYHAHLCAFCRQAYGSQPTKRCLLTRLFKFSGNGVDWGKISPPMLDLQKLPQTEATHPVPDGCVTGRAKDPRAKP
ncbi:hypothetical protein GWK47_038461 [Chionoecetes opilio]|uniref:Uncharacterized protein n=1 Tax=Chionoecetes opilio TaxID=41210 RepID=A0A8J4YRU3_CHIOP|nr:hypothetical protein GWK47_038461 [Chionoecetes opilio]